MEFTDILYEKRDGRANITINRPEVMNALRLITIDELTRAFQDAEFDPEIGVIVLKGANTVIADLDGHHLAFGCDIKKA